MLPSATLFLAGEELQLLIRGRWFYARNPFAGQFPAYYEKSPRGRCTVHLGPAVDGHLDIPIQGRGCGRRLGLAVGRQGIQRRMMLPSPSRNLPMPRTTRSTRNQIAVTGAPIPIRVSTSIITAVLVRPA